MTVMPLTEDERLRAIGSVEYLQGYVRRALDPGSDFDPLPAPEPGDWLAEHHEAGQSFDDFARTVQNRPDEFRNKIYLQPLGTFPPDKSPPLELLRLCATALFTLDVTILSPLDIAEMGFTSRINPVSHNRQMLTHDILKFLKTRIPNDAFCMLAITMEDLYPDSLWNFVFGQASLYERVGVFSFIRYDPMFYGEKKGKDYRDKILRRSCKVLIHETAHMFSMEHCIYYRCVLNGSNHLRESDAQPLMFCPVCLRKLQLSIGFGILDRYRKMQEFFKEIGFTDEARWVEKRLRGIVAGNDAK